MPRKLLIVSGIALLFCVGGIALRSIPALAYSQHYIHVLSSPPPTIQSVDDKAQAALDRAQDGLNTLNLLSTVFSLVFTVLGIVAGIFTFLGFRSYREVASHAAEIKQSVGEIRAEADRARKTLVYMGVGDRLMDQKNKREALENYRKAGSLMPDDAQIQYVLGRIYSGLGEFEMAIAAFETSLASQPDNRARVMKELGLAYRRRGDVLLQDDDYTRALSYLKRSFILDPNDADTLGIMGGLYRRQKKHTLAIDAYKRAADLDPNSSYALGNVASLAWYEGNVTEAKSFFQDTERAALRRIRKGQSEVFWDFYDLALAQLALGQLNSALTSYKEAIKLTPGVVQFNAVLNNLAFIKDAPQPMPDLDEVIRLLENARDMA
ncbi:tetratricopeptide repeat protein [Dictyobacter kobayashii]|uniref:Uncharacterized protein n=1 Tax=Dictyobacter kobayashii TaxID=2014872 RepID=A0A402AW19_9CHLR|nr:tetratricopeptide repeat protein [Dictyobacter kobayashii]GCE23298.1 hypothetical protein KDK_70980 [Dictyobacter kobayashii]